MVIMRTIGDGETDNTFMGGDMNNDKRGQRIEAAGSSYDPVKLGSYFRIA